MDPLQILGRLGSENPPTNEELETAQSELRDALDIATSAETPDLDLARDLRDGLNKVGEELSTRAEAAEQARAEAAALREGIFEDSVEDEAEEASDETEEAVEAEVEEPVAASASDLVARLQAHAQRLPKPEAPKVKAPGITLKPVGPAAGFDLANEAGFDDLGQLFSTHAKSITRDGSSVPLVRLERHFDEERQLGENVDLNNRKLAKVFGFGSRTKALTASGGLCGPGDVDHSHPICSDRGRPVRDAHPQFNASRGRLQFAPSASYADLDPNVSVWTSETDTNPGSATKPCPPIACPTELSESVDAVVKCITVGNFQARFSPEFWASRLELAMVAHDRLAEQKLIEEIHAASTDLPDVAPASGNSLVNFLATVNEVVEADRQINRNLSGEYFVLTDSYVRTAIRNQVLANLGAANNIDDIQVANSQINGWLSDVGVNPIWTPDGTIDTETGTHRAATPGAIPAEATLYIYPVEAFLFLDGGTLDLGTSITDSSLNATNDRQAFAETFEKMAFRGCSSYRVEIALAEFCGC